MERCGEDHQTLVKIMELVGNFIYYQDSYLFDLITISNTIIKSGDSDETIFNFIIGHFLTSCMNNSVTPPLRKNNLTR